MDSSEVNTNSRGESPDPSSHTVNIYDVESEWLDEDNDDMDFEPTADDSEDVEVFEQMEDSEDEFQGEVTTARML